MAVRPQQHGGQVRRLLREQGRDLHAEFVRLLPTRPRPIATQRWTSRRVGLSAAVLLLLVLAAWDANTVYTRWLGGGKATRTSLGIHNLGCDGPFEPLWLQAQSVPTATVIPCVPALRTGWTIADVAVNDGRSVLTLDNDRAGADAVQVRLTAACDPAGAVDAPASPHPGVHRYQRTKQFTGMFSATWYDQFAGGCLTYQLHSTTELDGKFTNEIPAVLGYISRRTLQQALETRSSGRLHLDPGTGQ